MEQWQSPRFDVLRHRMPLYARDVTFAMLNSTARVSAAERDALAEVRARGLSVTDDTAACELIGVPVQLVECPDPNPKVTVPADLPVVSLWL
jgi:hypothetical protein